MALFQGASFPARASKGQVGCVGRLLSGRGTQFPSRTGWQAALGDQNQEREEEPELQASKSATREAVGGHCKSIMRNESGSKKVGG